MYNEMIAEIENKGNSDLLPIVHGYSSVLKAICTNESLAGIERCRRSMGGHGFSQASGFDFERNQPNAGLIYEGENSMLLAVLRLTSSSSSSTRLVSVEKQHDRSLPILSSLPSRRTQLVRLLNALSRSA